MFDWNDEELTNIIWGEAGEGDDHIVPYQEGIKDYCNKKELSQEAATIMSLENVDPIGREVSDSIDKITKNNSTGAVKPELDKDPEIFQNTLEDKDQGDFDYSWANIGSFDDLDQIFSNDDPIFSRVNLGSADELWSSTKDVTDSPAKSFPLVADSPSLELGALKNSSDLVEVKSEFEPEEDQSLTRSRGKLSNPIQSLQSAHAILDHVEYPRSKSKPKVKEQSDLDIGNNANALNSRVVSENISTLDDFANKGYRQKILLKGRKKSEEKRELLQDFYGTWSPTGNPTGKYENQLAQKMLQSSPSLVLSQPRQLQKSETLQYHQIPNSLVTSTYGNITKLYPAMPVLPHVQSGKLTHQPLLSCNEVFPGKAQLVNKSATAPANTLAMTPQEKIEKLRRRQQMQAMLAIQKQQQQFSHQISSIDHSISQKFQENQFQHVEGADLEVEDLSALSSFDPNSPIEQDDSNTINLALDNYSVGETVLYRLQDVISKLDVRIRLCIRDSLFRLAQSAMQRHYASDTSSTNKSSMEEPEVVAKAETNSSIRYLRMPDAETETNPIDRAVAILLFHRPLEQLGKHYETPKSPKFPTDHGTMNLMNLPMGSKPEVSNVTQNFSDQGSKEPGPMLEPQPIDRFKTSPCLDTSENASYYEPAGRGGAVVEASQ
ncbi:hypothetical protein Patl1_05408 [Pistacia atlantica]|uniref:Uncharacterized protein n=1 Tax=Pistacia atlantica TaxID=434234 RepID=A0ACC1BQV5_9ROSI|nr:hypothetical protein Patl1_05408 [Pistacia atlantica]